MSSFGKECSTPRGANKATRRRSLADRSASHRNDENAKPPTPGGSTIGGKMPASVQAQAYLQSAIPPAARGVPPHAGTPLRGVGGGSGGNHGGPVGTANHIVENYELKRRQKELESMVRGAEERNTQLEQQNIAMRAENERAIARAIAEKSAAIIERTRVDAASVEAARACSDAASALTKVRVAQAELTSVRAELASARAETKAAVERAEAMEGAGVRAAAELARLKGCLTRAEMAASTAKDATSQAEGALSKSQEESSVLCRQIEALAEQVPGGINFSQTGGRRRGRGAATTTAVAARGGAADEETATFMRQFVALVSAATKRELCQKALQRFLLAAHSPCYLGDRESGRDGDDDSPVSTVGVLPEEGVPAARSKPITAATTKRKDDRHTLSSAARGSTTDFAATATAAAAAATAAVAVAPTTNPLFAVRPTTLRREQLNARRAEKDREARRVQDEQDRERAERLRESREKRKKAAAARQQAAHTRDELSLNPFTALLSCPPTPPLAQNDQQTVDQQNEGRPNQQTPQAERQRKMTRAQPMKSKRAKLADQRAQSVPPPRRQEQRVEVRDRASCRSGNSTGSGSSPNPSVSASRQGVEVIVDGADQNLGGPVGTAGQVSAAVWTAPARTATATESQDEAAIEEVPMPAGDIDVEGFLCGVDTGSGGLIVNEPGHEGLGHGVGSHTYREALASAVHAGGTTKKAEVEAVGSALKPVVGSVTGGGDVAALELVEQWKAALEGNEHGVRDKDAVRKRRRSMRLAKYQFRFQDQEDTERKGDGGGVSEPALDGVKCLVSDLTRSTLPSPQHAGDTINTKEGKPAGPAPPPPPRGAEASPVSLGTYRAASAADVDDAAVSANTASFVACPDQSRAGIARRAPAKLDPVGVSKPWSRTKRFRAGIPPLLSGGASDVSSVALPRSKRPSPMVAEAVASVETITAELKNPSSVAAKLTRRQRRAPSPPTRDEERAIDCEISGESETMFSRGTERMAVTPFSAELAGSVSLAEILRAARSWLGKDGPGGVLTGVLAAGEVLMEKGFAGEDSQPVATNDITRHLRSLVTAIAAAESCAMKHELSARATSSVGIASTMGRSTATSEKHVPDVGWMAEPATSALGHEGKGAAEPMAKKSVRFCAFDLSTVDMPSDAVQGSSLPAKEVADCLTRVLASSEALQEALKRGGSGLDAWKAFVRGLQTVALSSPSSAFSALNSNVRVACGRIGTEVSGEVVTRAAIFLQDELEAVRVDRVSTMCPLRTRLAIMLSALIRFNLRVLLNPPPLTSSVPSVCAVERTPASHSKVCEVVRLLPEEKRSWRKDDYDPTRDGATSAVVSRALRRLYRYSDEAAVNFISDAEISMSEIDTQTTLSKDEVAARARRHSLNTVDVVAAIRARKFMLELLEFPGVEGAIAEAGGWREVERLSKTLRQVKDAPDTDESLTLLSDVQELKRWLGAGALWDHEERAKAILTKLDMVSVACDKKEAKRFSQEARRRMWFPRVFTAETE